MAPRLIDQAAHGTGPQNRNSLKPFECVMSREQAAGAFDFEALLPGYKGYIQSPIIWLVGSTLVEKVIFPVVQLAIFF